MRADILKTEPIRITSIDDLDLLLGNIHDEYFVLDEVKFDENNRTVQIPYRRIFHDGPRRLIWNLLIFRTYEVDVIRSLLTIRNVENYSFKDSAKIGDFSFNTIKYDGANLVITCCEPLELRLVVKGLDIESRDVEIRGKARIDYGPFWESNTSRVYE